MANTESSEIKGLGPVNMAMVESAEVTTDDTIAFNVKHKDRILGGTMRRYVMGWKVAVEIWVSGHLLFKASADEDVARFWEELARLSMKDALLIETRKEETRRELFAELWPECSWSKSYKAKAQKGSQ